LIVVLIELVNDSTVFNLIFTELDRVDIVEFIVVDIDASDADNEFAADALNDCVNEFSEAETISKFDTFNVKSDTFPPPDTSNESNLLSTDVENGCMLPTKLIAVLVTPNRYNVELPLA
jgi:hypothetical protein